MWINVFWLLNQISVDIIWRTSFHIYTTIHNIWRYSALLILMSIILYQYQDLDWCMSSRCEVSIRIIALLQRKTLIERKNRTLKCLKLLIRLCDQWKMLQCWRRTGHLTAQEYPPPGICHPRQKNANARGSARGVGRGAGRSWNWPMHYFHVSPYG